MQLVYISIWNLPVANQKIELMMPAIIKPKILYTGKQVISTIIRMIADVQENQGLSMESKSKVASELKFHASDESQVILKDNELVQGVLDKNQLGSGSDYGLVHSFYELYGPNKTGQLLTAFAKLFNAYLQIHGFTCGMDDLLVNKNQEKKRIVDIQANMINSIKNVANYVQMNE